MDSPSQFRPKILGMVCNWCCYGGADLCGVSRFQYPPYIRLVRIMCSGRVDMQHIFQAFFNGVDGMFVGGCHLGDCHYITHGNYIALSVVQLCKKILEHIGINPNRLRLEWVSAGEGIRFAEVMNEFSREVQGLGPVGGDGEIGDQELQSKIAEVINLIPYIKVAMKDKLTLLRDKQTEYEDLYTSQEIEQLFSDVPSYYIDPEKCQACMICLRKCPVGAIIGAKKQIHVIDQEICIKCGTCYEACPPRFAAVNKLIGEPAPPPIPEDKRTIIRKSKK